MVRTKQRCLKHYLKDCLNLFQHQFLKALLTDREMSKWAKSVQLAYHKYSPQAAHYSLMRNISAFEGSPVPYESARSCFYVSVDSWNCFNDSSTSNEVSKKEKFVVPVCNLYNPRDNVVSIDKAKCKIMNSKKVSLCCVQSFIFSHLSKIQDMKMS